MHERCHMNIFRAMIVTCGLSLVSLACFLFWWSKNDYFEYNAIGTVNSVEYCKTYDKTEWASESIGRISVSFQLLDDNTTYENEIFTPSICSLHSCCKSLVGKTVYFQVDYSAGNYTVIDLSYGEVQDGERWAASGIMLLTLTAVLVYCFSVSLSKDSTPVKPIDEVELLEESKTLDTSKLSEVD